MRELTYGVLSLLPQVAQHCAHTPLVSIVLNLWVITTVNGRGALTTNEYKTGVGNKLQHLNVLKSKNKLKNLVQDLVRNMM